MTRSMQNSGADERLLSDIQYNCDVSDARDHGIYSMCSMVLKLRSLYKWEHRIEPWKEPESAELLDWIEAKESYWEGLAERDFRPVRLQDSSCAAHDTAAINRDQAGKNLFYGAGHGRSMKSIFFLSQVVNRHEVEDQPVVLLGRDYAREMAAPFALVQDNQVIIRLDSLRFFLYDHIQELRSSSRSSFRFFLDQYGLLRGGSLDQQRLPAVLEQIVTGELDLFIFHEVGEILDKSLNLTTLHYLFGRFGGSVIEFVCRAVKDVLADTHPRGVLAHIIKERRESTLSLYVSFLDGLRAELFPEMSAAWNSFLENRDWQTVQRACSACRRRNLGLAEKITRVAARAEDYPDEE
ncbi:MAG: hypothetical protein P8X39_02515, partial [Desulfofustis sp.]